MTTTDTTMPPALLTAHAQACDELRRADTKVTTLLSLVGATLAGVIALTGRPWPVAGLWVLWCSAVPIAAAVVLLLLTIRPRLIVPPPAGSWLYAAYVGPTAVLAACAAGSPTVLADDLCVLARIVRAKYRRIQLATTLLLAGLGALGVALALSAALPH